MKHVICAPNSRSFGAARRSPFNTESRTRGRVGVHNFPEPKVVELVRAGRIVLAHWESGDLAAQIRRLSRALEEFVQLPDEG